MTGILQLRPEPYVGPADFTLGPSSWSELDERLSAIVGTRAVAIPSVRVGLCWALQFLGLRRHADHVLVPRFMGRCILNSLNRVALPVEVPTSSTRALIAVHQYGFKQRLESIEAACRERDIPYVEDSPFAVEALEAPGPGSLAKMVGCSKVLPVLKGGLALSGNARLLDYLRDRRKRTSGWSWPLFGMLVSLRWSRRGAAHSSWADLAYEIYPESSGDNVLFRSNFAAALQQFEEFEAAISDRLSIVRGRLGSHALIPDAVRLTSVVLLRPGVHADAVANVMRRHGMDGSAYHFDIDRNMLSPRFERVFLLPLNPRIPLDLFSQVVAAVAAVAERGEIAGPESIEPIDREPELRRVDLSDGR